MMLDVWRRLSALALLLPLASCDRRPDVDDAKTFRFINRGDIFTLDLNDMSYGQDIRVTYLMREGLYSPTGPKQTAIPADATGCDVSPDKTVYTFHLRPQAKWSNGDPVTSADYAFSWRHMLEQPGEYTYLFYYIKGAEQYKNDFADGKRPSFSSVGVETPDPLTLKVTLALPVTYFLDIVAFTPFYPRNERSMEPFLDRDDQGNIVHDPKTGGVTYKYIYTRPPNVVCNGPFTLTGWEFKRTLRFTRNPYYWDQAGVRLNEVDMIVNENPLSQYLQYQAGAVDWIAEVPAELASELKNKSEPGLKVAPAFGTAFLTLNCKPKFADGSNNPMYDLRIRQALAMALDKSYITERVTRMGEKVATQYIPPGTIPGYDGLPGLSLDVTKAERLLAEAGYPDGRGFPRLTLLYTSENTVRKAYCQILKNQWKQALNVDVEIQGVEGKIFTQRVSQKDFQIATVAWFGDYPDVSTFTDKYLSTSLQNDSSYENPAYDQLLAAAAAEPDAAKRLEGLRQAEHLLNTEVPIIPLYHYVNVSLIGPRVSGLTVNPRTIIDWKHLSVSDAKP